MPKILCPFLLAFVAALLLSAAPTAPAAEIVLSARIAEQKLTKNWRYQGKVRYIIETEYQEHDFAACFEGVAISQLKANSKDAVFGCPIDFILITSKGAWAMGMNNVHGVFTFRRAQEIKPGSWVSIGEGKEVYLPALYDRLRAAGVNILSTDDLMQQHRKSREERELFYKQYRKVKP